MVLNTQRALGPFRFLLIRYRTDDVRALQTDPKSSSLPVWSEDWFCMKMGSFAYNQGHDRRCGEYSRRRMRPSVCAVGTSN
jgi:hypothetical protein